MINTAAFAALMAPLGPFPPSRRVAVAVSGGADSMALAWLARGWGVPFGLIVDHGLRPESAAEAGLTARRLGDFGVPARILTLRLAAGPALAARARAARYAALLQACRAEGLTDLLLGHHARDQAETLLMRQARQQDGAGLAGMAACWVTEQARLLRPLLGIAPGVLRATLRQAGIAWVEDPSNDNPAAERVRWRRFLDDPAGDGPGVGVLLASAAAAATRREAAIAARDAWLANNVALHPEGYALLPPGPWPADALAALARAIGAHAYPPPRAAVAALAASPRAATLAGSRLLPAGKCGPGMLLLREAAAMAPPIPAVAGALWDGRFRLPPAAAVPESCDFGALGGQAARLRHASTLPAALLATLPVLRRGGTVLAVPLALAGAGLPIFRPIFTPMQGITG